jgi:outer membrane protein
VVQQVAQAWNNLQAQRASLISNEEQVRAARVAFEGVQAEAQAGLRTTLDVLNAAAELRQAELDLHGSRRNAYVAGAQVLNAMGLLEARMLTPGVEIYDPAANFNRVRGKGWLPWEPVVETLDKVGAPPIEDRPVQPNPTVARKPAPETKTAAAPDKVASLDGVVDAALAR